MKTVWRCAALAVMAGALSACYYEPAFVRSGGGAYIGESAPVYSDPYPAYPAYYGGGYYPAYYGGYYAAPYAYGYPYAYWGPSVYFGFGGRWGYGGRWR